MSHEEIITARPETAAAPEFTAKPAHMEMQNYRGEFPEARATIMGIVSMDSMNRWTTYDERLARVQELEIAFVSRMVNMFPGQELTKEEIAAISHRSMGVVADIGKNSLGRFCESKRDDSAIEDIKTSLDQVRIAQASVMLGIPEEASVREIDDTIRQRLPQELPEQEIMSVYYALKIPTYYQQKPQS